MLQTTGVMFGEYLNADDIARDMGTVTPEISMQAQEAVRERRRLALVHKSDHSFETVMSHASHIDHMRAAQLAGFEVRLFFVATDDPLINLQRVAQRVERGGHDVPRERVIARYHRSLGNLPAAIAASDVCDVFDNTSISRAMRRIARIRKAPADNGHYLAYDDVAEIGEEMLGRQRDPADMPLWWLGVLQQLKPDDPFRNGPLFA